MKKIYIAIMIIVICILIALIYRLDNKHNKLNSYNFVVNDPILNEKEDSNKATTIFRYDKNTNTTVENSTTNEDRQKLENNDLNDKTEQFKNIFYKYYGEAYSKQLFSDIQKELYENIGEYEIPESSMIILEKAIQLLENKEISESEREVIKYILDAIDTTYIDDINVLNSLENLGIELDN